MTQIGLNVPPGFTITTEACLAYLEHEHLPDGLLDEVRAGIKELERKSERLLAAMEPLLIVMMFLMIGSLVVSIMIPLMQATSGAMK